MLIPNEYIQYELGFATKNSLAHLLCAGSITGRMASLPLCASPGLHLNAETQMRTGCPKQPLIVTNEERQRLESLAHRTRSQALLARRARVGLGCAEGLDNKAVAKKLRCSLGMVGKWRSRFVEARLEGLYDEPRPGAPRKISDDQVEKVVIQTLKARLAAKPMERARFSQSERTQPDDN